MIWKESISASNKKLSMVLVKIFLTLSFISSSGLIHATCLACYFPIEYQGTFMIQTHESTRGEGASPQVTYSEVSIEADAIPPWGRCHKRRGNNIILKDTSGNGGDCLRCFHLTMKTPNVIQLHTEGLERCYTNEEAARARCPLDKDIDIAKKKYKEIILFRKHIPGGLQSIEHVFCPFNGRFRFTYSMMGSFGDKTRCEFGYSEMSNCPHGNALNVKFRKCTFPTMDVHFLCLGDWESTATGDRYLALMDLREDPEARPKYRCGLYKEDHLTGQISVSLSSDSTCTTQLSNSSTGFESLILSPIPTKRIPPMVDSSKCRFPDWMQGKWQRTKVENNQFIYKDEHNQFRTIRSRCVMRHQSDTPNDRFVVHSVTQCGEQSYSCLWAKRLSPNIMEFKFSNKTSSLMNEKLCDDRNFATSQWITEGKEKIVAQSTPCPITGDYTGEVPGATGFCAKVASDCNNPEIMFYSVSSCENRSHVYEEREYRCLGNWEENGVLYTFTQRRDMPGHQCFAGIVRRNGDEAYIKEAGESCMRGENEDPLVFGMKIIKQASCPRLLPIVPNQPSNSNSNTWQTVMRHDTPKSPTPYPPVIKPMVPVAPQIHRVIPSPIKPYSSVPIPRPTVKHTYWEFPYEPVIPTLKPDIKPYISGHSHREISSTSSSHSSLLLSTTLTINLTTIITNLLLLLQLRHYFVLA